MHLTTIDRGVGRKRKGVGAVERFGVILQEELFEFDRYEVAGDLGVNLDGFERENDASVLEAGNEADGTVLQSNWHDGLELVRFASGCLLSGFEDVRNGLELVRGDRLTGGGEEGEASREPVDRAGFARDGEGWRGGRPVQFIDALVEDAGEFLFAPAIEQVPNTGEWKTAGLQEANGGHLEEVLGTVAASFHRAVQKRERAVVAQVAHCHFARSLPADGEHFVRSRPAVHCCGQGGHSSGEGGGICSRASGFCGHGRIVTV